MTSQNQQLCDIADLLKAKAEWWRTNPDDSHGINTAVYVTLFEVAQAMEQSAVTQTIAPENLVE